MILKELKKKNEIFNFSIVVSRSHQSISVYFFSINLTLYGNCFIAKCSKTKKKSSRGQKNACSIKEKICIWIKAKTNKRNSNSRPSHKNFYSIALKVNTLLLQKRSISWLWKPLKLKMLKKNLKQKRKNSSKTL